MDFKFAPHLSPKNQKRSKTMRKLSPYNRESQVSDNLKGTMETVQTRNSQGSAVMETEFQELDEVGASKKKSKKK